MNQLKSLFLSKGKSINLRKKEFFSKQGQWSASVGFVASGCFKLIYKNGKKEWIKSFIFEDGIVGSLPSILEKKPSSYSIQAIEPSEIYLLSMDDVKKFLESEIVYLQFLTQFLSNLYLKKEERVSDFLLLEPEGRYKKFIHQYAKYLDRISQIDQAAYLGITNVALSRIKSRVFPNSPKLIDETGLQMPFRRKDFAK